MEIKALSGKDICAIIETCSKSQVKELVLGDLSIKFGPGDSGEEISIVGTQLPSIPVEAVEQNPEQDDSFIEAIQSRVQEEIVNTQTMMDDPEGFEEQVVNSFVYQGGMNEN